MVLLKNKLPVTEDLDFAYLLELMRPLHNIPEYSWLPELFSIVGHESLLKLCKFAGGEIIKIPTIDELVDSIDALQYFYDIYIKKKQNITIPIHIQDLVYKIIEVYNAQNDY